MPDTPSYTILNVDGNEAGLHAKTRILAPAGYHVIEARNGTDALRLVREARPHLVVLGLEFPGLSGPEICEIIKTSPATAHTMVLQISAAGTVGLDPAHGLDGSADYWLAEPIDAGELLGAVRVLLRLYQHEMKHQRLPGDMAEGEPFIRRLIDAPPQNIVRQRKALEEVIQENEAGLVRSEQQLQDATEAAQCGTWDWDIATGRLDWLGAHERLAGLEPGSFSGTFEDFLNLLHPDDRPRVRHDLQAAIERRDTRYADEYRYLLPDGGIRWMAGTGRLSYDDAGRAARMTGIVLDIHERKLSEERLQNKTARLALLAEAAERLLTQECSVSTMEELYSLVAPHFGIDSYWDYDSDDAGGGLRLVGSAGITEETAPAFQYLRFGEALCGTCAQARAPIIVERLQEFTDPGSVLVKQNGNRAYACYPLIIKGQLFGTLAFASRSREVFEPEETEFLGTIARYVAMVKSRKRTEAGLQKRHKRAELLARVEATLLTADDSTALTHAFFEMIREDLGLDGYLSYTVNENESLLILESSGGIGEDALSSFQRIQPDEGLLGTSWQQRQSMVAERVQESGDPKTEGVKRLGFRLYACYPLMIGERCLGILSFGS
ncbi:MAG TPA: GAF domain-containing protein, partial [Nitrospiraceae bacterium]|nr:GAF domain-containing protein [Nitrospiraceae bacterium]